MKEKTNSLSPKKGILSKVDNYFGINAKGSTFRTEIIAGIVTFLAMAYILTLNPNMILGFGSVDTNPVIWSSVFMATALGAIVGTLLMAFLAKMPLAQASGLGLNSALGALIGGATGFAFSYGNGMLLVLISGILFVIVSIVPVGRNKETGRFISLREKIFDAIPSCIRNAITVGIGLFIAHIGLKNSGIVTYNAAAGGFYVADFSQIISGNFANVAPAIICIIGFIVIAILSHYKIKGAVIIGILFATLLAIPFGVADVNTLLGKTPGISWAFWENFGNFFSFDSSKSVLFSVFTEGFDFSNAGEGFLLVCITSVISFSMIDMFDTMGTVVGCTQQAGLVDEHGKPLNYNKIMVSDSIATATGAIFGTSTVTTFVESGSGIAAGGKTGLTALSTAGMFFLALFLLPLFAFIPSGATASALIYVGVLMMGNVKNIDFKNIRSAVPSFMTLLVMVCGYSITDGIGFGLITYVILETILYLVDLIKHFANKEKNEKPKWIISPIAIVVMAFFIVYFIV